jgi:HSP20 family protein
MASLPARRSGQNITVLNPSREFEDIYDRMGQLMNLAFGDFGLVQPTDMPWTPRADVSETDDAYVVHAELPGVTKDQVDVQLMDRELVIRGEMVEREQEDSRKHRSSRRTGRFELRIYLPGDVKADGVTAQLSDGVLRVTVPKPEKAKPRKIEITG